MRIIAVNESESDLIVLRNAIEQWSPGCVLDCFRTPRPLKRHLTSQRIDVAFLEMKPDGIDGFALADCLRALNPRINIIFVAAHTYHALEAFSIRASGYMLRPFSASDVEDQLANLRYPITAQHKLRVQCSGRFEVFSHGEPLSFSRSKTKELFAYLVNCQGAACTNRELAAVLWQDRPNSDAKQSHLRLLVADLVSTLRAASAEDVLFHKKGWLAISMDKLDCDLAAARANEPCNFMTQYNWTAPEHDNLNVQ